MTYWIFWGIDAIAAAILVVFFFIGLVDGSVSSLNMALWLVMLGGAGLLLWAGDALRRSGSDLLRLRCLLSQPSPRL